MTQVSNPNLQNSLKKILKLPRRNVLSEGEDEM